MEYSRKMIENKPEILTAREGYMYTNGVAYGKRIRLAHSDSAENWHEITDAEYEEILKAEEEQSNVNIKS